ncbi:MAG: response regulator [Filomicrobium sp.]
MEGIRQFIQSNQDYIEAVGALSSVINLLGWTLGGILLYRAWRRNAIESVSVGPISFRMEQEAVEAAAAASRNWKAKGGGQAVDVQRIRETVGRAFSPEISDNLLGRSVLWVDDNPSNNELAVRALRKLQLDVVQELSTQEGLAAMQHRHFDLVISDMGRGDNMTAGYELLEAIRMQGNNLPFLIFAGSDTPEFRREAAERGAQLSTNDMLELIDTIVSHLGER